MISSQWPESSCQAARSIPNLVMQWIWTVLSVQYAACCLQRCVTRLPFPHNEPETSSGLRQTSFCLFLHPWIPSPSFASMAFTSIIFFFLSLHLREILIFLFLLSYHPISGHKLLLIKWPSIPLEPNSLLWTRSGSENLLNFRKLGAFACFEEVCRTWLTQVNSLVFSSWREMKMNSIKLLPP